MELSPERKVSLGSLGGIQLLLAVDVDLSRDIVGRVARASSDVLDRIGGGASPAVT